MAGTVEYVMKDFSIKKRDGRRVVVDWTSDGGGDCSGDITGVAGFLEAIETIPGTEGDRATALPSANYNVTLRDPYNFPIASGELLSRSGTEAETLYATPSVYIDYDLSLIVANAGNAKKGRVILFLKNE